ncbi:hypothetical protein SUNI508_09861 [Seiridium unicorne]|uniref:Uncharacterized protein n=1 Tax=Seiridium unicorne TaxID=138068 RepID=A0ABR2UN77_9PEZI
MGHKHHQVSRRHHDKSREKTDKKEKPSKKDAEFGTEGPAPRVAGTEARVGPGAGAGMAWSSAVPDASKQFVYRAMTLPNGGTWYRVYGPQADSSPPPTSWWQTLKVTPPTLPVRVIPPKNDESSDSDSASSDNSSKKAKKPRRKAKKPKRKAKKKIPASDKVIVEKYRNNDVNIVTPKASKRDKDRNIVVILEAGSDMEVRPVNHPSRKHGSGRHAHGSNSRPEKHREHRSRHKHYEVTHDVRGTESRLKVTHWLDGNASGDDC